MHALQCMLAFCKRNMHRAALARASVAWSALFLPKSPTWHVAASTVASSPMSLLARWAWGGVPGGCHAACFSACRCIILPDEGFARHMLLQRGMRREAHRRLSAEEASRDASVPAVSRGPAGPQQHHHFFLPHDPAATPQGPVHVASAMLSPSCRMFARNFQEGTKQEVARHLENLRIV
jgi:hypothetical protein